MQKIQSGAPFASKEKGGYFSSVSQTGAQSTRLAYRKANLTSK